MSDCPSKYHGENQLLAGKPSREQTPDRRNIKRTHYHGQKHHYHLLRATRERNQHGQTYNDQTEHQCKYSADLNQLLFVSISVLLMMFPDVVSIDIGINIKDACHDDLQRRACLC